MTVTWRNEDGRLCRRTVWGDDYDRLADRLDRAGYTREGVAPMSAFDDTPATAPTDELLAWHMRRLTRWVKRANRWFALCQNPDDPAWNPRKAPSKVSKHEAYADGAAIARLTGKPTPHTYAALCALVGEPDGRPESLRP